VPARKPRPKDEKPQFDRFIETVRKVEADETDATLERAIDKIARRTKRGGDRPLTDCESKQ
jgi:hypothetical protein